MIDISSNDPSYAHVGNLKILEKIQENSYEILTTNIRVGRPNR